MLRGVILAGLLTSACSPVQRGYDSTARTFRLREAPIPTPCHRGLQPADCVVLLKQDYEAIIIDWKAKCLQLGGSAENCQTTLPP
jgi:hypothetical protein